MSRKRIAWHPAFHEAIQAELIDYHDVLTFEAEHVLNTEPLRVDVLIIKNPKNTIIKKNIGTIFKAVNIVEFKSRTDNFSYDDFHKVCAYTNLFLTLNKMPVTDITMTIILTSLPRIIVKYIEKSCGYSIFKKYPGIHEILGNMFPIQIIETKELSEAENIWLSGLGRSIDISGIENIFLEQNRIRDKIHLDAYLNVIAEANRDVMMEVLKVSKTKTALREMIIEVGLADEWKNEKGFEVAETMYAEGESIEKISKYTKISVKELMEYFKINVDE